jgi:hypothetical protein
LHAQPRPFLIVGADDIALGQALAVAHALNPDVRLLGVRRDTPADALPADLTRAMVLIPTGSVRATLGPGFHIEPWAAGDTWALATAAAPDPALSDTNKDPHPKAPQ